MTVEHEYDVVLLTSGGSIVVTSWGSPAVVIRCLHFVSCI